MVNLVNYEKLLKHDRTIKVGNVGYDLVGLWVYVCWIWHTHNLLCAFTKNHAILYIKHV